MKSHPGMALVLYGEALAAGKTEEAARRRRALDKMLAAWPYAGDAASVRELLAWAEPRLCKPVTEPGEEMSGDAASVRELLAWAEPKLCKPVTESGAEM